MKTLLMNGRTRMNGTRLKLIGIILMVCDHINEMFAGFTMPARLNLHRLNMLGRLVFPIFLFMVAEGMHYTRSRKNYLLLLFSGSVVMTLGNYFLQHRIQVGEIGLMNNVFGTLLLTGLYIVFYDMLVEGIKIKSAKKILSAIGLMLLPVIAAFPAPWIMNNAEMLPSWTLSPLLLLMSVIPNVFIIEGGFLMVSLGVFFYIFRKRKWAQIAILAVYSLVIYLINSESIQWMMVFAAIPILLYNGQKGKGRKWLFYIFYPLHIWILYIAAYCTLHYNLLPLKGEPEQENMIVVEQASDF